MRRLVPGQDAQATADRVALAVRSALPEQVKGDAVVKAASPAWYVDPDHPALRLGAECLQEAFDGQCLFIREGGSIPVVGEMARLGPVVLMGYGMRDERIHAPDEFFRLDHFHKGAVACGRFLEQMAQAPR